eukprot:CAMPEP_0115571012 /NCGR_PEP_ID=MMETSP0271-20121206/105994_1 /TAXON_ID=71861 /ORGANISM="Scrippsiella trochoidea, Strain CCMP3099" /LENGTH=89 /DNA_ID=CAMNT_0003005565 /DNA_START=688 /DNA_END=954 /DNA_ORIENTATION=+
MRGVDLEQGARQAEDLATDAECHSPQANRPVLLHRFRPLLAATAGGCPRRGVKAGRRVAAMAHASDTIGAGPVLPYGCACQPMCAHVGS